MPLYVVKISISDLMSGSLQSALSQSTRTPSSVQFSVKEDKVANVTFGESIKEIVINDEPNEDEPSVDAQSKAKLFVYSKSNN